MKKVQIFTTDLFRSRSGETASIQDAVNEFIKDKPDAEIQWLQSSVVGYPLTTTQLTAIITYSA